MSSIVNYIFRNMDRIEHTVLIIANSQTKMKRSVNILSMAMIFYVLSTSITLQKQHNDIENLKREISKIKKGNVKKCDDRLFNDFSA